MSRMWLATLGGLLLVSSSAGAAPRLAPPDPAPPASVAPDRPHGAPGAVLGGPGTEAVPRADGACADPLDRRPPDAWRPPPAPDRGASVHRAPLSRRGPAPALTRAMTRTAPRRPAAATTGRAGAPAAPPKTVRQEAAPAAVPALPARIRGTGGRAPRPLQVDGAPVPRARTTVR